MCLFLKICRVFCAAKLNIETVKSTNFVHFLWCIKYTHTHTSEKKRFKSKSTAESTQFWNIRGGKVWWKNEAHTQQKQQMQFAVEMASTIFILWPWDLISHYKFRTTLDFFFSSSVFFCCAKQTQFFQFIKQWRCKKQKQKKKVNEKMYDRAP